MAEAGRAEAAITWLQACARMGVFDALQIAVQLLSGVGREEEAQSLSPDLSQGLMAAAGGRASRFLDVDFRPGV